jgi:glycosyltransferase involved in cell wall biosynthesis
MGWEGKFVAIYAGILGIAQGLETVIEAAKLLRDREDIRIVIIGEGPSKNDLTKAISEFGLANVVLISEQPREQIPSFLSASDAALIPLRNVEIFKGALPSKLFDAWACQRPVLLSVDGEARILMEQARAGLFVPPEDSEKMASAILQLKSQPETREEMGVRGRELTIRYFSRKAQAENLAKILTSIPL